MNLTPYSEVTLTAYGLSCPLCANNLDGQLLKVDGVQSADIDLQTGAVTVRLTKGHSVTPAQLANAVKNAGFTLKDIQPQAASK